jgi:type I restriction enzyme S subunit
LRDDEFPLVVEARQFVERLWAQCAPYLDSDLPVAARHDFQQRFWELYLTHVLLENGVALIARNQWRVRRKGPDLLASDGGTWIEAVLASPGTGADAVQEPEPGKAGWVPTDAIKLRLLNAIDAKLCQYKKYQRDGIVRAGDRYVIAVGTAAIYLARLGQTIPYIVCAVLPFGPEQVHIDRESLEIVGESFAYQPTIAKQSGTEVPTTLFQDAQSAPISALLYAWTDEGNRAAVPGHEFVTIHNPLAANPLPRGFFPFGREYWFEDQLYWVDHRVPKEDSNHHVT